MFYFIQVWCRKFIVRLLPSCFHFLSLKLGSLLFQAVFVYFFFSLDWHLKGINDPGLCSSCEYSTLFRKSWKTYFHCGTESNLKNRDPRSASQLCLWSSCIKEDIGVRVIGLITAHFPPMNSCSIIPWRDPRRKM